MNRRLVLTGVWLVVTAGIVVIRKASGWDFWYYALLLCAGPLLFSLYRLAAPGMLERRCGAVKPDRRDPFPYVVAVIYAILLSTLTIAKYESLNSPFFDLGAMDQAVWNTSRGRMLEGTTAHAPFDNQTRLSTHVEPVYFVFAAAYVLFPHVYILLIGQTLFLAGAVILMYKTAGALFQDRCAARATCLIFAMYPPLHYANLFGFHGDTLAVPLVVLAYSAYLDKKRFLYWAAMVGALLCKEYVSLVVIGMGLLVLIAHKEARLGMLTASLGLAYFFITHYLVIPAFNDGNETVLVSANFSAVGGGQGLWGMIRYAFAYPWRIVGRMCRPGNMENLFYTLMPLQLTPLFSPGLLIALAPSLLKDMLFQYDIYTHHAAPMYPIVFFIMLHSVKRVEALFQNRCALFIILFGATLVAGYAFGPLPLGHRFWRDSDRYTVSERDRRAKSFCAAVPDTAALSASSCLASHLTHRRYCYLFPRPFFSTDSMVKPVSYFVIDTTDRQSEYRDKKGFREHVFPLLKRRGFGVISQHDGLFIFARQSPDPEDAQ